MLIDTHAHLTAPSVLNDIGAILERAEQANVKKILNIATQPEELTAGLNISKNYPWVYHAAATTPHDAEKTGGRDFSFFEEAALNGQLKAIGETGLDYHYFSSTREAQKNLLIRNLKLARQTHLPIIIHCREAFSDLFEILDEFYVSQGRHLPGVLHCFTGTAAEAETILQKGWFLSFSGIVTFKKSESLREIAKMTPLEQLLIETDTPYLAPQKKRGHPNEPAFLIETAECISQLKKISINTLAKATTVNAQRFFQI
jgi:TatD DNase family protein